MSSVRRRTLGYADRPTTSTDMVFVGTGIVLGGFVGLLSVTVAGIPLTLTASGGALVMGLVFGWLRSVYPFFGRIPEPAIWIFDTVGLCIFIGVVGLSAGPSFVAGLQKTGISLVFVGPGGGPAASHPRDSLRTLRAEDGTPHRARRLRRSRDDHGGPARHPGRGAQQRSRARLHRALRHRQHPADGLGAGPRGADDDPRMNWLFLFLPVTLALEHAGAAAPWVFFSAALAIVPIASLIVRATEQIAARTGDAVGGLLNATFGNAHIAVHSDIPATPFVWTAKAHDILQKVIRANRRLSSKKNEALH